jgi:hypothetical protein
MDTKITLTPEDVSKITGLSLQKVIKIAFPESFLGSIAGLKAYRGKQFVLTEEMKFVNPLAVGNYAGVCLLRKAIEQSNNGFPHFLYWVCKDAQNVKKIDLVGRFKGYKSTLSEENRKKTINKLADIHYGKYGDNTQEYKLYKSTNYVHQ